MPGCLSCHDGLVRFGLYKQLSTIRRYPSPADAVVLAITAKCSPPEPRGWQSYPSQYSHCAQCTIAAP